MSKTRAKVMGKGTIGGKAKQAEDLVVELTGIQPKQVWSWPWLDSTPKGTKERPGYRFETFFGKSDKDALVVHVNQSQSGALHVKSIQVSSDKPNKLLVSVWPSTRDEAAAAGVKSSGFEEDLDAKAGRHFSAEWRRPVTKYRSSSPYTGTADQFVEHIVKPVLVLILGGSR
jgi:hypothetical protein